jgi:hypothetical protein
MRAWLVGGKPGGDRAVNALERGGPVETNTPEKPPLHEREATEVAR